MASQKNQAELITAYCDTNKQYCLDYYSIDTHDMDDNYRDDTGDDGNSPESICNVVDTGKDCRLEWRMNGRMKEQRAESRERRVKKIPNHIKIYDPGSCAQNKNRTCTT